MKRVSAIFGILVYFSLFAYVYADILINEIMYDAEASDEGVEWIEVYNDSDVLVDFTTYKLFESDTNHKIGSSSGGASLIPKSYGIISNNPQKFLSAWPKFSGVVFKSSFTLNNTGEKLALKNEGLKIVDEYTYSSRLGSTGDGNTLQKVDGKWVSGKPTPGGENKLEIKKVVPKKEITKVGVENKTKVPFANKTKAETKIKEDTGIPNNKLEAQAIGASPNLETKNKTNLYFYIALVGMIVTILSGAWFVSFVRKKKVAEIDGADFEILEE